MRGLAAILGGVLGLVAVLSPASAHPGRLDADGCHDVHYEFRYSGWQVRHPSDRHCHRALGDKPGEGPYLNGQERLEGDAGAEDEPEGPGESP